MADPKKIQLLLVEDCQEDDQFLRDAISEIIETPHWPNWHTCELIPSDSLYEALEFLERQRFDVILLNLSLPDGDTLLGTFARVHAAARDRPIIVLADGEDETLAHTLLREGAQDVLVKSEIDCMMLARSIRYAIERQRRVSALESVSFFDELTGLYNHRGFAALAQHDVRMAEQRAGLLLIAVIELAGFAESAGGGEESGAHDLTLIRAADLLRSSFGETAVIGRLAPERFAVCTTMLSEGGADSIWQSFEQDLERVNRSRRRSPVTVRVGCATYSAVHARELTDLLEEAESRLAPKTAMLAH